MKIKVADLRPNPYRDIGKYPIDRSKVNSLKLSISGTSFWDNVLCRRKGKVFEIAYGHHRVQALKELGIKEVNIPVKKLSDAQMVKIMAEENLEWLTSPKVIYQTVLAVRRFLDGELAKVNNYEALNKSIKGLTDKEHFHQLKDKGVGQKTIVKFLGGNWKQGAIQTALQADDLAKEKKLNMKAVTEFDSVDQARQFQNAVKDCDIPLDKQVEIAAKVKQNLKENKTVSGHFPQSQMTISEDVVTQSGTPKTEKAKKNAVERIIRALVSIESQSKILAGRLESLRANIKKLGITQMQGLQPALAGFALSRLESELQIWKGLNHEKQNSGNRRIVSNVIG